MFIELVVFALIGKYLCEVPHTKQAAVHCPPWPARPHCRYDGRGHLHDLSEYEAAHSTWNRDYPLSEEEARVEALCDEERYLALHTDLLEEEARQGTAQEKPTSATKVWQFFKYLN